MYQIRRAELRDIETLIRFRQELFEANQKSGIESKAIDGATREYLDAKMKKDQFVAWIAETESEAAACSAVSFYSLPPKPWNLSGRYAYVSSMFTKPEHRKRGLARQLLQAALEYIKAQGVQQVTLHASQWGESLYSSVGFQPTNEMRMTIKTDR